MPKAVGKYKVCSRCGKKKLLSEFAKNRTRIDRLQHKCRKCSHNYRVSPEGRKNTREWWAKNSDRIAGYKLKQNYGITAEDYQQLFEQQQGLCAICGKHQSELKKRLFVDHNHKNGKVRQLLCVRCNTLLGFVDENIEILESAIKYLKEYNG